MPAVAKGHDAKHQRECGPQRAIGGSTPHKAATEQRVRHLQRDGMIRDKQASMKTQATRCLLATKLPLPPPPAPKEPWYASPVLSRTHRAHDGYGGPHAKDA
jgi:hypothetical protein